MKISEMIKQIETLKEEHGDLPVLMRDVGEDYGYPYLEVETIQPILNEVVHDEGSDSEEILNFIALDYC